MRLKIAIFLCVFLLVSVSYVFAVSGVNKTFAVGHSGFSAFYTIDNTDDPPLDLLPSELSEQVDVSGHAHIQAFNDGSARQITSGAGEYNYGYMIANLSEMNASSFINFTFYGSAYASTTDAVNHSWWVFNYTSQAWENCTAGRSWGVGDIELESCFFEATTDVYNTSNNLTHFLVQNLDAFSETLNWDFVSLVANFVPNGTEPSVVLEDPSDGFRSNVSLLDFNYTVTDDNLLRCDFYSNFSGVWQLDGTDNSSVSGVEDNFTVSVGDGDFVWNVLCSDEFEQSSFAVANFSLFVDSLYPVVDFAGDNPLNNSNLSSSLVVFNFTHVEENPDVITLWYNGVSINKSFSGGYTNFSVSLGDGEYNYSAVVNDSVGNVNFTPFRVLRVDASAPVFSVVEPVKDFTYSTNGDLELNYTVEDVTLDVKECFYEVVNSSGQAEVENVSLVGCGNTTFGVSSSDSYVLRVYANDSVGNLAISNVSFSVSLDAPATNLDAPFDGAWLDYLENVSLNFTSVDSNGVSVCSLHHNFTGVWALNESHSEGDVTNVDDFFVKNITEGSFVWNVNCSDTLGEEAFAATNFSVNVDVTDPVLVLHDVVTAEGSQTVTFDVDFVEGSCNQTFYSVHQGDDSIENGLLNVSSSCSDFSGQFVVSAFDTYTMKAYVQDKAGNLLLSEDVFTTMQLSQDGGSGGGGGGVGLGESGVIIFEASNFSVKTLNFGDTLDMVLAKDSVRVRERRFLLVNEGLESVQVSLRCDSTSVNDTTDEQLLVDICDYVEFENSVLSLSSNELENTEAVVRVRVPENATFGDRYSFNIVGESSVDESTVEFAKLSVVVRVPLWGLVFKWSYFPLQGDDLLEDEKRRYPVFSVAFLVAVSVFSLVVLPLRKRLQLTAYVLGFLFFFVSFLASLWFL